MKTINLQPSLLIIHRVTMRGGIRYKILERSEEQQDKQQTAEWKTERVIFDKKEFDKGRALRAKIENLMRTATSAAKSDIGLFAPDLPDTFEAITTAEREIQALIDTFHASAYYNKLNSQVITFRIQSDNRQALEAVSDLIQTGLEDLKDAVKNADVKNIRAALKDLKGFDQLLPDTASAELQKLIADMRKKARDINRLVNKQGKALDDSDVIKLMNAAQVDTAEMIIFETPEQDGTTPELSTFDVSDFTPTEIPTEAPATSSTAPEQITEAPADFQPDTTPEPEAVEEPATEEETTAAPVPEHTPDTTPEHEPGKDWTDPDADAEQTEEERDTTRVDLLTEYEATDSPKRKREIREALEAMDAATAATEEAA